MQPLREKFALLSNQFAQTVHNKEPPFLTNVDLHLSLDLVKLVFPFLACMMAIVTLDGAIFQLPLPCHAFIIQALIETDETRTPIRQSHLPVTACDFGNLLNFHYHESYQVSQHSMFTNEYVQSIRYFSHQNSESSKWLHEGSFDIMVSRSQTF